MANYFVLDNTFDPYSFDELVKPYLMYRDAYKEQEAAANKLESDAATLASAISQTNDPNAYQTYNLYLDRVRQAADDLATNGLTLNSRRAITSLGRDYNNSIVPIQAAYNRRKELQDEQRKAMLANDSMMFQRDFNVVGPESSIDRFIEDPNYSYGKAVSGNAITARTSEMASHLAKELTDYGQGKPLDKYTNTFLQAHGFTKEQVLNAIQNPQDPTAEPVLNAIARSAVDASGVPTWNDEAALKRAYDYAGMGLWSAIGQSNVSTFENYGNRLAAQEAMQKRVKAYNPTPTSGITGVPFNPLNIYNQKERTKVMDNISRYSKYFTEVNGKYQLSEEGKKAYEGWKTSTSGVGEQTKKAYNIPNEMKVTGEFRTFMDSISKKGESLGQAWSRYLSENQNDRYDATLSTEYDYNYSSDAADQRNLKTNIITAAGNLPLKELDWDPKANEFKPTGRTLDLNDFNSDEYSVVSSRSGAHINPNDPEDIKAQTQIIVMKKDGTTARYEMPTGINQSAEASRDEMLRRAEGAKALANNPNISAVEALDAYNTYLQSIQQAYQYQSQIGLINETKPQQFEPYSNYQWGQ